MQIRDLAVHVDHREQSRMGLEVAVAGFGPIWRKGFGSTADSRCCSPPTLRPGGCSTTVLFG